MDLTNEKTLEETSLVIIVKELVITQANISNHRVNPQVNPSTTLIFIAQIVINKDILKDIVLEEKQ